MDADFKEKRRERISSLREKRWSMNSQRLEEIVAELMRPIGDLRHSFDTDLSALLEEYLTEAGLHALAEEEDEPTGAAPPNFAELALLLQQSASIYGRKVDCLYQHVLSVSETLHNSTIEITNSNNEDEPQTPSTSKRKRKASVSGDFDPIELEAYAGARREAGAARPPPTLPRMYLELEPRVLAEGDEPLKDYTGEPIGLLADFHVAWRLQEGLLVDELEGSATEESGLRPIPLLELQAAIEAAAPPSPPPLREDSPQRFSTPLPPEEPPPPPAMPPPLLPVKKERKRRNEVKIEDLAGGTIKLLISKELRVHLSKEREFDGAEAWVSRVVAERAASIVRVRKQLETDLDTPCYGFEFSSLDISGFAGWSGSERAEAAAVLQSTARAAERLDDSDDDGFFEQSSLGDSDASRHDDTHTSHTSHNDTVGRAEAGEWAAWRARAVARAAAEEARPALDVRALAAAVLRRLPGAAPAPAPPPPPRPFPALLAAAATDDADVSRLFLATLFLANAGNVEVVQGPPLTLNSFSLRLLSTDESLYCAAAAADPVQR